MSDTLLDLSHLNDSQRRAVEHFCGPMLVVAGAGSGKTRALTYRVANLIHTYRVNPENIMAVTFTNKAAREMKSRIERLFSEITAQTKYGTSLDSMREDQQTQLRSHVWKTYIKPIWVGTFHSLCARILRYDINKYQDEKGRQWTRNFSIFDENDVQSLFKQIVTEQLNLDDRKFNPKKTRYAIGSAKNKGWTPRDLESNEPNYRGRVLAEIYETYQDQLASNNALDFDDLIRIPTEIFQQNEQVLDYWHRQFHHILVDEYQDTNRTQYDLIRLLVTNGESPQSYNNWQHRSIFVVGDVDQSIYSFRMADFTILMNFQDDFGDGLPDEDTRTMIKLEENYRSRETILHAANQLIQNNSQRIDKVLRPTRGSGDLLHLQRADNEIEEAEFITSQILALVRQEEDKFDFGSFAILYRTNAQSRVLEEAMVRWNIPYNIIGGFKFYDRKEIKDILSYLRVLVNPFDSVSLLRIINTPKRGIGKTTVDKLKNAAQQLSAPLWEVVSDEDSVKTLVGKSAKRIIEFSQLIRHWQQKMEQLKPSDLVRLVMEESGYEEDLKNQSTDEAKNRLENLGELINAVLQYEEENVEATLDGFLSTAALNADTDNLEEEATKVALMTLHSAKGLEFPVVFLSGVEEGLLPHFRSLEDPLALEEERRLAYVGITRAQERLFLTYTQERRTWGNTRQPAMPSKFLGELPQELLSGTKVRQQKSTKTKASNKASNSQKKLRHVDSAKSATKYQENAANIEDLQVGDRVLHRSFGVGEITHVFRQQDKPSVAVKFGNSQKILNPKTAKLQKL